MSSRHIISFPSRSIHVSVQDIDQAETRYGDTNAADGFAREEITLNEMEWVAVERVRGDP